MLQFTFQSSSVDDTERFAKVLSKCLSAGQVLALNGQLGSGKTTFVRSLCQALQIDTNHVNSPTFVLMQLYTDGRIPIAHFDTYRLSDSEEFLAIGGEDFLYSPNYLCLIEWADRIESLLPPETLKIDIQQTGMQSRQFLLSARSGLGLKVLQTLASQMAEDDQNL